MHSNRRSPATPPPRRPGRLAAALAALALAGCSTTYDLTLMPRTSGKLQHGTAVEIGTGQAEVHIEIGNQMYIGNWVRITPEQATTYVGASSWGWAGWGPFGTVDRSTAGTAVAKALLQAADGSGLRCDLYGLTGGSGSGQCTDDKGLVYDVQIRTGNPQ